MLISLQNENQMRKNFCNLIMRKKLSKIQQPLTCQQSNEARRTTKIRSVVERVFGALKKNEAIDNMRNTVLEHNAIDL